MTEPQEPLTGTTSSPLPKRREVEKTPRIGGHVFSHIKGNNSSGSGHVRWKGFPLSVDFHMEIGPERTARVTLRVDLRGEIQSQEVWVDIKFFKITPSHWARSLLFRCPVHKKGCRQHVRFLYLTNEGVFGCRACARVDQWSQLNKWPRQAIARLALQPDKIKQILESPYSTARQKSYALKAIERLRRKKKRLNAYLAKYGQTRPHPPAADLDKATSPQTPSVEVDIPPRPHTEDSSGDFPY